MSDFTPKIDGRSIAVSDSSVAGYEKVGTVLRVWLQLWDGTVCEVTFDKVAAVMESVAGELERIELDESPTGSFPIAVANELSGKRRVPVQEFRFFDPEERLAMSVVSELHASVRARAVVE